MGLRIYYDGLNLALQHGTGIATYTRMLMNKARESGHSVSAVYSVPTPLAKNAALREISFYDPTTQPHFRDCARFGLMFAINIAVYSLTLNPLVSSRPAL
jgi:hypothetical protein